MNIAILSKSVILEEKMNSVFIQVSPCICYERGRTLECPRWMKSLRRLNKLAKSWLPMVITNSASPVTPWEALWQHYVVFIVEPNLVSLT